MRVLLVLLIFFPLQVLSKELDHKALALEYIDLSNLKYSFTQPLDPMPIDGLDSATQNYLDGLSEQIRDAGEWESMQPFVLELVLTAYSAEELVSVNTFLKSSAGKIFTRKNPMLEQKIRDHTSQRLFRTLMGSRPEFKE